MQPKDRVPQDYKPDVFQRIVEDIYGRVGNLTNAVKAAFDGLSKRIEAAESAGQQNTGEDIDTLTAAPTITVVSFWRIILASVTNPFKYRIFRKGLQLFEWHVKQVDSGTTDFTPDETTLKRTSFAGRILMWADDAPAIGKIYLVKCRAVSPLRGSYSSFSSASTASPDSTPPATISNLARLTGVPTASELDGTYQDGWRVKAYNYFTIPKTEYDKNVSTGIFVNIRSTAQVIFTVVALWPRTIFIPNDKLEDGDTDLGGGGDTADGKWYFAVDDMLTSKAYKIKVKAANSWFVTSAAWSNEVSFTTEGVTLPTVTITSAEMVPLRAGFFKRVRYRIKVVYDVSSGTDLTNIKHFRFQIQNHATTPTLSWYHHTRRELTGSSGTTGLTEFITMRYDPRTTYTVGNSTGWYILIQPWVPLIQGSWTAATAITYAAPDADDGSTTGPTPTWALKKGHWRTITVKCDESLAWDYPNNFSHFSIHARIKGSTNWTPDTTYPYVDMIHAWVGIDSVQRGINCFVPIRPMLDDGGTTSTNRHWLPATGIEGGGDGNLEVKLMPWSWNASGGTMTTAALTKSAGATNSDTNYEPGDDIGGGASVITPVKRIAAFGGDIIMTKAARITFGFDNTGTTNYRIWCDNWDGESSAYVFADNDVLMIHKAGTAFNDSTEYLLVTDKDPILLPKFGILVTRGLASSTKETGVKVGDALIKIGTWTHEATTINRIMVMDSSTDTFSVWKYTVADNPVTHAITITRVIEAQFGAIGTDGAAIKINYGADIRLNTVDTTDFARIVFGESGAGEVYNIQYKKFGGYNELAIESIAGTAKIQLRDDELYISADHLVNLASNYINIVPAVSAKLGDAVTNYTEVFPNGTIKLHGEATAWDDLRIEPVVRGTGTNNPAFDKFFDDVAGTSRGVYLYAFSDEHTNEDEIHFTMQMPHNWKGTAIKMHVHWVGKTSSASKKVQWGLEYIWKEIGSSYTDTTTIYASAFYGTGAALSDVTAGQHVLSPFADITPGSTADGVSSILIGRLFRNTTDTTNDTYTGDCGLLYIDAHYEIDAFGSGGSIVGIADATAKFSET